MYCLIKEWPNKMATLMTEDGVVLWTFNNVQDAHQVWQDWCSLQEKKYSIRLTSLENQNEPT